MSAQLEMLDIAGNMFEKYDSMDLAAPGLLEVLTVVRFDNRQSKIFPPLDDWNK